MVWFDYRLYDNINWESCPSGIITNFTINHMKLIQPQFDGRCKKQVDFAYIFNMQPQQPNWKTWYSINK